MGDGRQPAARGIAHEAHAIHRRQRRGERRHRRAIGAHLATELEFLARQHHADAVIADRAADQQHIAVANACPCPACNRARADRCRWWRDRAHRPARAAPPWCRRPQPAHRRCVRPRPGSSTMRSRQATSRPSSMMALSVRKRGLAPEDRQIVDRAVDRERADIAAGKFQRLHREAIGGDDRHQTRRQIERRGIELHVERRDWPDGARNSSSISSRI